MSNPLPAASAIVLAGGKSSRFGGDKLAAELDGRQILQRAVDAVAAVASEVIVVVAPGTRADPPVADVPVRAVADPVAFGGPVVGVRTGLEIAREPLVLIVAGDMPAMRPELLALLLRTLDARPGTDAVALVRAGRVQPLPVAGRLGSLATAAQRATAGGGSLRELLAHTRAHVLNEGEWRPLDPEGRTLADVDEPADLERLRRRP